MRMRTALRSPSGLSRSSGVSLFVEEDLKVFESIDGECLAPVTSLRKARSNWSKRKPRLEEAFPHNRR